MPISERPLPSPRARLLLIEDDLEIAGELAKRPDRPGLRGPSRRQPDRRVRLEARRGKFDLLIVDAMLPETDGLSVIEGLRRDGIRVPVLVVSALGAVNDRVRGLQIGGDDYVTKPFAHWKLLPGWTAGRAARWKPGPRPCRSGRCSSTPSLELPGESGRVHRTVQQRVQAAGLLHAPPGSAHHPCHVAGGCLALQIPA